MFPRPPTGELVERQVVEKLVENQETFQVFQPQVILVASQVATHLENPCLVEIQLGISWLERSHFLAQPAIVLEAMEGASNHLMKPVAPIPNTSCSHQAMHENAAWRGPVPWVLQSRLQSCHWSSGVSVAVPGSLCLCILKPHCHPNAGAIPLDKLCCHQCLNQPELAS